MISSRRHADVQKDLPELVEVDIGWDDLSENLKQNVRESKIVFQDSEVVINELIADESSLWSQLQLDEIFNIKNTKLTEFEKLLPPLPKVFIERTFKRSSRDGTDKRTVDDVIALLAKQRTLVLADSAGMGKTTSAISLATKLKKENRLSWIVFVDLKRHTAQFLKDDQDQSTPVGVEFFIEKLLQIESNFEQRLFQECYKTSKTIFVIDGFDEISPSYKKFVLRIMKAIQESKNRLLATTRVHLSDELESKLGVKAITFHAFNADNQKQFLTSFWKANKRDRGVDVQAKVKSVLDKLRLTLGHEFLEVPLQLFMLAEINEIQHKVTFDEKQLNYYSMYEQFVSNKIDIWINRGPLALNDNTNLHKSPFNVLQMHQKIALEYFFEKDAVKPLLLPKISYPLTDEMISRIGIMKITTEDKFLFVHQTFAEFLVAAFILMNILTKTPLSSYDSLHRILLSVFNDEKYANIRKFVDGHLAIKADEVETEDLAQKLQESLKIEYNRSFLTQMVEEKHLNIVSLILSKLAMEKETKLQLVHHRANKNGNTMHIAIKNYEAFNVLWRCVESFSEATEVKELLFAQGWAGRNVLGCAIELKAEDVLKIVLEFCNSAMNADEVERFFSLEYDIRKDSFRTALQEAAKFCVSFPAFERLWDTVELKLSTENQKKLLLQGNAVEFFGFFYNLENNSKAMNAVLKAIKKIYNKGDIDRLLRQDDLLFKVLLFYAEEADKKVFETFWLFVGEYLDKCEQKSLLLQRNDKNEHIFLFPNDYKDTTKFLFAKAAELLDPQIFFDILFGIHEDGRSGFGTAFDTASLEVLKDMLTKLEAVDKEATKRHIREYLLKIDDQGEHVLHRLFAFDNGPDPIDLAKFIMKHLTEAEMKALAFHQNNKGCNLFFYIAENSKIVTKIMVFWALNNFTTQDWQRMINGRDNESRNILHHICYKGNQEVPLLIGAHFDWCLARYRSTNLDFKPMLLAVDDEGRTPLESSLHNAFTTVGIFQLVWKGYEKILTHDELENVVFEEGKDFFSIDDGKSKHIIRHLVEAVIVTFGIDRVLQNESVKSWLP